MGTVRKLALAVLIAGGAAVASACAAAPSGPAHSYLPAASQAGKPSVQHRAPASRPSGTRGVLAGAAPTHLSVQSVGGQLIAQASVGVMDPVVSNGKYQPIDPPYWNQAAWVRYPPTTPPAYPSDGTTYIYGHACHHHTCPFTSLPRARLGDIMEVTTPAGVIDYRITQISTAFPKSGDGALNTQTQGIADPSIPNRLILISCAFEHGDTSTHNYIVVGTAQSSRTR